MHLKPIQDQVIVYAAEHPVRDLYAGGAAKMMIASQMLMPGVVDKVLSRAGIPAQRTDDTASGNVSGNLFEPSHDDRTEGDFSDMATGFSPYTWLQTHPKARSLTAAGAVLGLGLLLSRKAS